MATHDVRGSKFTEDGRHTTGFGRGPAGARKPATRWAALLVAGLWFGASIPPVFGQTSPTLVGNIGQPTITSASPVFAVQSVAMQFSTGASTEPWTLAGIQLEVKNWQSGVTPTVSLHGASGQLPGARIAALTNPATGSGSKIFAAPSGSDIALQANTTYTVVVESQSFSFSGFSLLNTNSAAEDDGGAPGWQIADARLINQGSGWSVSTSRRPLKIAVLGAAEAGDATLSALTLTGTDGSAVDLDPSFAAGTTSYTAAAAHSVSAIAVSATATDASATLSIANDDDASTPGSAALDLEVGENVVTVTVAAADGVTTEVYAVTVTRAAAAPTGPTRMPRALVGNIGQATAQSSSPVFALQSVAMQFATGASAGSWNLTGVQLEVRSWDAAVTPIVSLHGASGRSPGARIATLTNPSTGTGSKIFAVPAGADTVLQANTTYTVVVESRSSSFSGFSLLNTESAAEDDGGAPGWRIDDTGLVNRGRGWSVSTTSSKPKIAVLGAERASDATLSALTLADGDGNPIGLDPAFAAGTTSYTATAAHSVNAVTLSASATDAGATLTIASDDDASTPGSAALDLAVGGNAVSVTVTAADGVTTETYTVTVTRAAPPATGPAPAAQTLVGNFGQRLYGSLEIHKGQRRAGIKFTTGDSATAWNMAAIRLFVTTWHPDVAPTVKLRRVSGRWPGSTLATLTNPARSTGLKTFRAPSGLKLQPNTTYAVVVASGTKVGRFSLGITKSNHQDSGSAAGWSIANTSRLYASGGWSSIPQSLMMAVQGAPVAERDGLTGWVAAMPGHHDGSASFSVQIGFSDPIRMSPSAMRDHAVQLSGGRAISAEHLNRNGNLWNIEIAPAGRGPVSFTVAGGRACDATGAVCTGDGRALANTLALTVPGPLALSVVDASAREGVDSHVIFAITLNRAADRLVTVNYATRDRTARAGQDYYAKSGTTTFTVGTARAFVSVPVLNDAIDEGEETFAFILSNPSGAAIADGEGTGTIVNDDPIPKAWIARFGRTVAGQAVDAIAGRLEGGGPHVTIGGQAVSLSGEPKAGDDVGNPLSLAGAAGETRTMTGRDALHGSSFRLAAGDRPDGAGWTAWGRFATGGFDADTDGVRLDGSVVSGFLGADFGAARWLAGVALGLSEGEGDFTVAADEDRGNVESTLTAVYPYVRLRASENVDVWGLVGYGEGELALTLRADANRQRDERLTTDIAMRMGAVGARGQVISPSPANRLALAVRSDAFWVRTKSDAVRDSDGNLEESEADASRLRLLVEGSRAFATGEGIFTPKLELGLRHDGGDAETGTGIEAGAGLRYSAGIFAAEGSVRTLLAHEDGGYEEWGAAGSLRIDPGASGRGLSLSLNPSWGAAADGEERLWSLADARGLARIGGLAPAGRIEAELGYGFGLPGGAGVATPWAGFALGDGVGRTWRGGARWRIAPQAALTLEGARTEPAIAGAAAEHSMAARLTGRW